MQHAYSFFSFEVTCTPTPSIWGYMEFFEGTVCGSLYYCPIKARMSRSDLLNGQGRLSQCDIVRDSELLKLIKHIKPYSLIVTYMYFNENNIHFLLNLVTSQVSLFASRFLFN